MGIFSKLFRKQPQVVEVVQQTAPVAPSPTPASPEVPKDATKVVTYKVAGVSHYADNIMALSSKNEDFQLNRRGIIDEGLEDTRIWEYDFYPIKAELVPEPDNPHDPKAIKVLVDGLHVGYIKAGSCAHLLRLLREGGVERIDVKVGGGRYKCLECVDYTESGKEVYELDRDTVPLYVHLTIEEKTDI